MGAFGLLTDRGPSLSRSKKSAGLLLYRLREGQTEVFLVHPGGPLWAKKDDGAWSIPKGEFSSGEAPLSAALREFEEEVGFCPDGPYRELPSVRLASGKEVFCWLVEGDCDPSELCSNTFSMEWPPRSGRIQEFPEVDRGAWFGPTEAFQKLNQAQRAFLTALTDGKS